MTAAGLLFAVSAGLYGLAAALYLGFLVGLGSRAIASARWLLIGGFFAHMCEIGARGVAGIHPVTSVREALGFLVWVMVGAFLLADMRSKIRTVGAFVAPAALALLVVARLAPAAGGASSGLGVVGRIHISLAAVGVAMFALATGIAFLYLVQERQFKRKRIGALVRKGTALETLDSLGHRLVQLGFAVFTVAMITGAWWSARRASGLRPEHIVALVAWLAFAGSLTARSAIGWRGRRAAVMTILGFSASLAVLAVYIVRRAAGG